MLPLGSIAVAISLCPFPKRKKRSQARVMGLDSPAFGARPQDGRSASFQGFPQCDGLKGQIRHGLSKVGVLSLENPQ
jgi:hypothetical protein